MLNYFNFKVIRPGKALITNDFGEYLFITPNDLISILDGTIAKESALYDSLRTRLFIVEEKDLFSPEISGRLRSMKSHLFSPTTLHILVMTNACNLRCRYCQAKANGTKKPQMMSKYDAMRAVDIALQSPANSISLEFQGGEPLMNYQTIVDTVLYAERAAKGKTVQFSVVSNLTLLTEEMVDFFVLHGVSISTSLDGPEMLHDLNRPSSEGEGSHSRLRRALELCGAKGCRVGAIQTTTRQSLGHAKEIVLEHERLGLDGVFLRPLTPLGFAKAQWEEIGYSPDEFLGFYREALDAVIEINRSGALFPERHASLFLKKILAKEGINYMDLRSPCGAGIGQLAYNYDGNVYTCDEGRMLAEDGDQAFLLGNVRTDTYTDLVSCPACEAACASSVIECLPSCCDCVFQPYCGVCPVVTYASEGDIFPRGPASYRCMISKGIMEILFRKLEEADPETSRILESWVGL